MQSVLERMAVFAFLYLAWVLLAGMGTSAASPPPTDLIWLDPPPNPAPSTNVTVYYTREVFNTTCHVSKDPRLAHFGLFEVVMNSWLKIVSNPVDMDSPETKSWVSKPGILRFQELGSGVHLSVSCAARVHDSRTYTDLINRTWAVTFRFDVPPFFEAEHVNLTFTAGKEGQVLVCDAQGDPSPDQFTWDHDNLPGAMASGNKLVLARILPGWIHDQLIYCKATNKFGDSATKSFRIRVDVDKSSSGAFGGRGGRAGVNLDVFGLVKASHFVCVLLIYLI